MIMKKVLIFGCGGFVGGYLTREFYENGYEVIGTDILEPEKMSSEFCSDYISMDFLDADKTSNLIKNVNADYIINLAGISSVGNSWKIPQLTMDANVKGMLNIFEAVKNTGGNAKILVIGSSEEYAAANTKISEDFPIKAYNPYGISKVTQEYFSEIYRNEFKLRIINTRTFNHTGLGQTESFVIPSFVRQIANIHNSRKDGIVRVGNLSAERDFGDVRDMVRAYRMLLESDTGGTLFNVGSGSVYKLEEILKYIISLTDMHVEIQIDKAKLRPVDNPIVWCDNTYIKKEIGWEPRYTVFDAINEMFESYTE